jgi:hypothetical protein
VRRDPAQGAGSVVRVFICDRELAIFHWTFSWPVYTLFPS